jgi:hypothetical protein
LRSSVANTAQEFKEFSGQSVEGDPLLILSRSLSTPRVLSDEPLDLFPETCFETVA